MFSLQIRVRKSSDCQNYFWCAGQNVRDTFSALPNIFIPCRTDILLPYVQHIESFLPDIFMYFSLPDISSILTTAGQNIRQCLNSGHFKIMLDMSGIFSDHWKEHHQAYMDRDGLFQCQYDTVSLSLTLSVGSSYEGAWSEPRGSRRFIQVPRVRQGVPGIHGDPKTFPSLPWSD